MNSVETSIVDVSELPRTSSRGSIYGDAIEQAKGLEKGSALKITSPGNKHLRNTLWQTLKRKELLDVLDVRVCNKEVYIVKK